jgi:hypothetical protein
MVAASIHEIVDHLVNCRHFVAFSLVSKM